MEVFICSVMATPSILTLKRSLHKDLLIEQFFEFLLKTLFNFFIHFMCEYFEFGYQCFLNLICVENLSYYQFFTLIAVCNSAFNLRSILIVLPIFCLR